MSDKGIMKLLIDLRKASQNDNAMSQPDVQQEASIEPIGLKIKGDDPRWDKACEVAWLMSPAGANEAINLQLENLIHTYGFDAVDKMFNKIWFRHNQGEF
jgi:hypothetical protein